MAPRTNPATTALRSLLDALNDESDEDYQEARDKLSDEIERGHWPQTRVAVTQFLGADADADDGDGASIPPVTADGDDAESWGDDP